MTALTAKPISGRPKGVRMSTGVSREERKQLLLELEIIAVEAYEDGIDWRELDGWQNYFVTPQQAQRTMNYSLRDFRRAFVHCVGDKLYLRRVSFEDEGEK